MGGGDGEHGVVEVVGRRVDDTPDAAHAEGQRPAEAGIRWHVVAPRAQGGAVDGRCFPGDGTYSTSIGVPPVSRTSSS